MTRIIVVAVSLLGAAPLAAADPDPAERQKLVEQAAALGRDAQRLFQQGKVRETLEKFQLQRTLLEKLYPPADYPDGHADLARNLNDLGFGLQLQEKYEPAAELFERALAMRRKLHPADHADVAQSLNNLAYIHFTTGSLDKARELYGQTLAMYRRLYPPAEHLDGHPDIALSLYALGMERKAAGAPGEARRLFEPALAMWQRLDPRGIDPKGQGLSVLILLALSDVERMAGAYDGAQARLEAALALTRRRYPPDEFPHGHGAIALVRSRLGRLRLDLGSPDQALPHFEQALAIYQHVYTEAEFPDGHADVVVALNDVGHALFGLREFEKARRFHDRALAMQARLYPAAKYPAGHPAIAVSLRLAARATFAGGDRAAGLKDYEAALAMARRLFPKSRFPAGHFAIAVALNAVGHAHLGMGAFDAAKAEFEELRTMLDALAITQSRPGTDQDALVCLLNLGSACVQSGDVAGGRKHFAAATALEQRVLDHASAISSEADALAFARSRHKSRDAYLASTAAAPETAADVYRAVWRRKAAVSHVLERRHAAARVAGTEHAAALERLFDVRRQVEQVVQHPRLRPADRDRQLAALAEERARLERALARVLPAVPGAAHNPAGPDDLVRRLPRDAAFVDFIRYESVRIERVGDGSARDRREFRYAAFVLAHGQPIRRVELGPAAAIDAAAAEWRAAIAARTDGPAAAVRDCVWAPVARHLPAATTTVYLAPDGDLYHLPFAALPGAMAGTVLLEEVALAEVPHGPFLLGQLATPPAFTGPASILALGDVAYDPPDANTGGPYAPLPGTRLELAAVRTSAATVTELSGRAATADRLRTELAKARYAHLATHGFFDATALAAERKRWADQGAAWEFGRGPAAPAGVAARSPLTYTGLVLAGANRPAAGDPAVITGETLIQLSLGNLRLCVLSACESGLGDYAAGEGVFGLTRAFHLAGCPNVVASLWTVSDAATAALMTKFYYELWDNKKEPLVALREAQLTIYRRPDLIPDLAGERGAPRLKDAIAVKTLAASQVPAKPQAAKRSDTKLWAAFVLSGVGR